MWDLSCVDWEDRIRAGRSLVPDLPLIEAQATLGLRIFDELQLPDVPGLPKMKDAAGQWFRDLVRVAFGSWDPVAQTRYIRDILAMLPKGQSKTTYCAGLMLAAMLVNRRPRAEALFVGPTQAIADNAYDKAVGMIEASADLKKRFRTRDHLKIIEDQLNHSELRVKTFDVNILTGTILILALLDEIHLLGRNPHTTKVLRQIRGGLEKTPEGLLVITTTQSDDIPAGAFKDELLMARKIRDGAFRGKIIRPLLPILYEYPAAIARDQSQWQDTANWPMVMPNLGRSVHLDSLVADWETEKTKGGHAINVWASQHLNIEIGIGLKSDGWVGALHWAKSEDDSLNDLEALIERSEAIVIGVDGGGLDDLFGFAALGRCRETRRWLAWTHAWCHRDVLERRKTIAALLDAAADAGELTIVDDRLDDISSIVGIIDDINTRGLLAAVSVDPAGLGEFIEALAEIGVTQDGGQVFGAPQGYAMMNAIKTAERKLANGTMKHAASGLMTWCVGNVKIEPTATAIRATKQNAGDAKIDPVMALFDAVTVMVKNPDAGGRSVYDRLGELPEAPIAAELAQAAALEAQILADPRHPRFEEMRDKYNARLAERLDAEEMA